MSDRIGVMRDGQLVQVGTPQEIYTAPNSKFVSEFIGDVNVLPVAAATAAAGCTSPTTRRARFVAPGDARRAFATGYLVVRPEFAALHRAARAMRTTR